MLALGISAKTLSADGKRGSLNEHTALKASPIAFFSRETPFNSPWPGVEGIVTTRTEGWFVVNDFCADKDTLGYASALIVGV